VNIMLFKISWSVPIAQRVPCWNVFGKMSPADDLKDTGEHITVLGRWHELSGSGGVCICECSDASHLNSWMLNWGPICNISVSPVVDDAGARAAMQDKQWFNKTASTDASTDASTPQ